MHQHRASRLKLRITLLPLCLAAVASCGDHINVPVQPGGGGDGGSDGPANQGPALPARVDGDVALGRTVFRFETFNNERFFTDAVRIPAGMIAAGVTPRQLLSLIHI